MPEQLRDVQKISSPAAKIKNALWVRQIELDLANAANVDVDPAVKIEIFRPILTGIFVPRNGCPRALATNPDDIFTQYNVACVYSLLGDIEPALDLLEREDRETGGFWLPGRRLWVQIPPGTKVRTDYSLPQLDIARAN